MISNRDTLLCSLLNCGVDDLSMLDDIDCNWFEVIKNAEKYLGWIPGIRFNTLMRCVVITGIEHIVTEINDRVAELCTADDERGLTKEEKDEMNWLMSLRPYEDIGSWHNFLDTNVFFERYEDEYRKYLGKALDDFERYTGFSINGEVL